MTFLTPLFLLGLAGLAVPVIIHLIQRERKNVVQFPSLMFLQRIPYQSVRRRKIQHWLLLMVRLAALALIILAFTRPLIDRTDLPTTGSSAREVVILLDASYSMGFGDRWARAQQAARDEIARLTASDRGSVVLFGSGADIQLRSTAERSRLQAAVDGHDFIGAASGGLRQLRQVLANRLDFRLASLAAGFVLAGRAALHQAGKLLHQLRLALDGRRRRLAARHRGRSWAHRRGSRS